MLWRNIKFCLISFRLKTAIGFVIFMCSFIFSKMAASSFNVFVGSETGLLKGINISKGIWKNVNTIEKADKSKEIICTCWSDIAESKICVGLKNQSIAIYDIASGIYSEPVSYASGDGYLKSLAAYEESIITAVDSGSVSVWKNSDRVLEVKAGENLQCMSHMKSIIGTGGKENNLKIWDLNNPEAPVFIAKNVRNDWLNLRVPVWITGIGFLDDHKFVATTGHHQVQVYDSAVQRRPVLDMKFDEYPITAMSLYTDNQMVVGNTQGNMGVLDIRIGKTVHLFKGFAGAIKSVQCHTSLPIVISCGLDRFLRVHDIATKKLTHKLYLKSRLNCLLMSNNRIRDIDFNAETNVKADKRHVQDESANDTVDKDDVWNQMEVVKTRTLKRKEIFVDNNATKAQIKACTGKKHKK